MQFMRFDIEGLFGRRSHHISFPMALEDRRDPLVLILHGKNGVGKTTVLRMLDSLLRLDFNVFRQIRFDFCSLQFDNDARITVKANRPDSPDPESLASLEVHFKEVRVLLHPHRSGPLTDEEKPKVEAFRQLYFRQTESINYEFINTERLELQRLEDEAEDERRLRLLGLQEHTVKRHVQPNPKAKFLEKPQSLATRVRRFISQAQINYRSFFVEERELFPKIIERLTSPSLPISAFESLRERFEAIYIRDKMNARFGLEADRWDHDQIMDILQNLSLKETSGQHALTVLDAYAEALESRSSQRALVADRLRNFERILSSFLGDKTVSIDPKEGLVIRADHTQEVLRERSLSSGEFHLLLLMVAALVTRRRGTVIAIDEPEMSMHLEWQRRLIPALLECASNANPLFIFATHSPDLAASYSQGLVELK